MSATDPLWYKDAVIYQVHVRAFCDSTGDGVGDFTGLAGKLAYIRDLGVSCIWLLPFYPSPLRDDGYDIAHYEGVHPGYGTLKDFRAFLRAAHDAGLQVITELVINHTSDQHPWFQAARRAPAGSSKRDFYVWSDDPTPLRAGARHLLRHRVVQLGLGPGGQAPTTGTASSSHQPDLNFDNPRVTRAVTKVMRFWLDMGVDGMRLDAVPYLVERDGTNCESLPETHAVLKSLRRAMDEKYSHRLLLAEANQWPGDVRAYFGDGDECHMAFHFPLMPRIYMALKQEDRHPIVDIVTQTPDLPDTCQWAIFLRNHDELTLEMVTDEERDYLRRGVRHRSADARQRRHPAPAGAAARKRPAAHRAAQRAAVLAARHADRLLRRRDRDGRQHLPRRPQRRAHADAVDLRSQRRVLEGRSGAAVRPADHGCGLRLPGRQRRGAGALAQLAAPLDAPAHRPATPPSHLRPRHDSLSRARQPEGPGLRARIRGRDGFSASPICRGTRSRSSSTCPDTPAGCRSR